MSTRSARAMEVLSRFGELEWFSLPAEKHPVYGYPQVPYMGWRYTSARESVAHLIEDAVRALPTQVEWTLDRTRKNWLLVPTRILHEAQGLNSPAFANIVHSVNTQDQEFCFEALSDLGLILEHLHQVALPEE
ncbi:hypothetical protein ABT147_11820 [Streptomyces sp. NPDC001868]|uniref:hypothetical protein n=1 Tax=Streptomyces sp. NPDC001868 TaxID=3154401 RepID=UPI003319B696